MCTTTDRIFCHSGPFFALLPANNLKNQNFEKMKKKPGDRIILNKCTTDHDHMRYTAPEIWYVMDVIFIFHFGLFFALLHP